MSHQTIKKYERLLIITCRWWVFHQDSGNNIEHLRCGDNRTWVDAIIISGWWCVLTILKNDGVKVNGFRMTSLFYEMENHGAMFQSPPTSWIIGHKTLVPSGELT